MGYFVMEGEAREKDTCSLRGRGLKRGGVRRGLSRRKGSDDCTKSNRGMRRTNTKVPPQKGGVGEKKENKKGGGKRGWGSRRKRTKKLKEDGKGSSWKGGGGKTRFDGMKGLETKKDFPEGR